MTDACPFHVYEVAEHNRTGSVEEKELHWRLLQAVVHPHLEKVLQGMLPSPKVLHGKTPGWNNPFFWLARNNVGWIKEVQNIIEGEGENFGARVTKFKVEVVSDGWRVSYYLTWASWQAAMYQQEKAAKRPTP
jgi:hypothetical protein